MTSSETGARHTTLTDRTAYLTHKLDCVLLPVIESDLARLDLAARSYFVLAGIDQDTPPSQQDLARSLRLDPTTVVGVVDELEQIGYVTRMRNPADRRRYNLHLTPAGAEALARAEHEMDALEREFFSPLSADERHTLHVLLERVLEGR
ncbi:MarR family winged helix-turn-helix transcriptional regulator [Embleya scabrispora]|uniref:MarR family winged helix-turn-helix transcriptional regulator n=1 Tax=Embleya scabrispora TaxID=159449 RepID=UPI00035DCE11|nr:MarR family transcriptional regulator [Embleya scabrispora]MYS84625.1 MarR family transcriptional regulator [Streptomyces sp. SID5474]